MTTLVILQETENWLAIDKPSGVTVHNRAGEDVLSFIADMGYRDAHAVHRLDAGTSGCILIAKSLDAARLLHAAFASRLMEKTYLGLAQVRRGEGPVSGEQGNWTWSLTKRAESRKNPRGWAGGRVPCRTRFRVLAVNDKQILLQCEPDTGRKHQIRRHATLAGWPLIGDYRYGPQPGDLEEEVGMHLHAASLGFADPWTTQAVRIEAPAPAWVQGPGYGA